jgi:hypothetical protein
MTRLFISYSRRDLDAVRDMVSDFEQSGHEAWFDRELRGGQVWWDVLCEQIRSSEAFVVAVSPNQLASKACGAELAYATSLNRTILPILISDTDLDLAPSSISSKHVVDYRKRTATSAIALVSTLHSLVPAGPLPDPLPEPPPAPVSDLGPLRDLLAAPELSLAQQRDVLAEFEARRGEFDQQPTVRALLTQFRQRADIVEAIGRAVDAQLASMPDEDAAIGRRRPRRPLKDRDPETVDRLRSLVTYIKAGQFTPVVGHGVNDGLIGSTGSVAREWSRAYEFPRARNRPESLAAVAQFIAVMINVAEVRSGLEQYLRAHLTARFPEVAAADTGISLSEAMLLAWRAHRTPDDPYLVLAELPTPVYINANPWSLLSDALREAGRQPESVVCRWRPGVYEWEDSVFEREPTYVPSPDRPLVFHAFGSVTVPDSLVLTLDDFDDFQIAVAENRELIPKPVQRVLANSAIMLLGFELEDRDVRVLVRSVIEQEGAHNLGNFTHVAAQLEPDSNMTAPSRAQKYIERYFSKFHQPSIDIFWGTEEEFAADLAELWRSAR